MAQVTLRIAGRDYPVQCHDGEEGHIESLAALLDEKAVEAGGAGGGMTESRLLLFTALLLADELHELRARAGRSNESQAIALSRLADRIEAAAAMIDSDAG